MTARTGRQYVSAGARSRRPRGSLSVDKVLSAAHELVERDGLQQLTMERLARHLDCGVMSLYSHVPNKDALVRALTDRVMRELHQHLPPAGAGPWQDELTTYWCDYRAAMQRLTAYREICLHAPAQVLRAALTPAQVRRVGSGLDLLVRAGLSRAEAAAAYNACFNYTRSFVALEQALLSAPGPAEPEHVPGFDAPLTQRQRDELSVVLRVDEQSFRFGLALLVDGIARRVSTPRPSHRARPR